MRIGAELAMRCPCGGAWRLVNSRLEPDGLRWRRCRCLECGRRRYTSVRRCEAGPVSVVVEVSGYTRRECRVRLAAAVRLIRGAVEAARIEVEAA